MTNKNNIKYVPIGMKNDSIIQTMGPAVSINDIKNDTKRVLIDNSKAVQELVYEESDDGLRPDYVQLCGVIGFYCERSIAKEIIALQKHYIKLIAAERAKVRSDKDYPKFRKMRDDLISDFFYEVRTMAKDAFLPYAIVDFYDIGGSTGSFYGESDCLHTSGGYDLIPHSKGTIYIPEYLEKLEVLNCMEGVTAYDISIKNPIDYIKYCVDDLKGNTYFGYATAITPRGKAGKREFIKTKKSK